MKIIEVDTILIDMGWEERLGDWYPNSKFSNGMKWISDTIHSYGLKSGLWLSPFWVEPRSEVRREHPEWLLRDRKGELIVFHCHIDGYVIDLTIPEACEWIADTFRRVTQVWGFDLIKIDFLRAVSLFPEASYKNKATMAEALRLGMEAVRKGAGEKTFIIGCGGQYGPTLGLVDANRTSNDISANWESVKITCKKNILRYWMNGKWWVNDPDCLIIRSQLEGTPGKVAGALKHDARGKFTDREVGTIITLFEAMEGLTFLGDDLPLLTCEKVTNLKALLDASKDCGNPSLPRDMFKSPYPTYLG